MEATSTWYDEDGSFLTQNLELQPCSQLLSESILERSSREHYDKKAVCIDPKSKAMISQYSDNMK